MAKDKIIEELKRQMKVEKDYNEKFLAAKRVVKQREQERETEYQRFKRQQGKERENEEKLAKYLAKKS